MSTEIELRGQLEAVLQVYNFKAILDGLTNDQLILLFKTYVIPLNLKTVEQAKEELVKQTGLPLTFLPFTPADEEIIWKICEKFKILVAEKSPK